MRGEGRQLAGWLVARRQEIERAMLRGLEGGAPPLASPEAEALRRLRSFVASALMHGDAAAPALDGLRVDLARAGPLLLAWLEAAAETAGPDGAAVRTALEPLLARFAVALRACDGTRRAAGAPVRSGRRAVAAAIDRVTDVFLAIDTETGRIADANPAAGALLGTTREALLGALGPRLRAGAVARALVVGARRPRRGRRAASLRLAPSSTGAAAASRIEACATRFATRQRTLALVIARPSPL